MNEKNKYAQINPSPLGNLGVIAAAAAIIRVNRVT